MKALLTVALLLALVLAGGSAAVAALPATNCLDNLNGHSYSCSVKSESLPGFTFPANLSFNAGVLTAGLTTPLQCSCAVGGLFNAPKFNFSQAKWICVGADDPGPGPRGFVIQGNVTKAGKISKVTGADSDGEGIMFDCDLD